MNAAALDELSVADIVRCLADRIEALVLDLLPNGRREGGEWRCGSVAGEKGCSMAVHLAAAKAGVWADFADDKRGDALDLVMAVVGLSKGEAVQWAKRWLGLEHGKPALSIRSTPAATPKPPEMPPGDARWRYPWSTAKPIAGTLAETYLAARRLRFDDAQGRVLRFSEARWRQNPAGEIEIHPALLALLRDAHTGERCGIINIYLQPDGSDRICDAKGKTVAGRAKGAAVMLSPFCNVTAGLTICEGTETGIALLMDGLAPVWACGGMLGSFPVIGGIEAITIAADADKPDERKASAVAVRWHQAGREVAIVKPPAGDWAAPERAK
jgi:hypothetical protein